MYRRNQIPSSKTNLTDTSKAYKKKMNFYIDKYNKTQQSKLRDLHYKNPKQCWNILNDIENKKDSEAISLIHISGTHWIMGKGQRSVGIR